MPRANIKIDQFRDQIELFITHEVPYKRIVSWLGEQDYQISQRTFERRVQQWGLRSTQAIHKQNAHIALTEDTESIIYTLSFTYHLSDQQIVEILSLRYEIYLTKHAVKMIRLHNGWKRANRTVSDQIASWEQVYHACREAVFEGPGRSYGRVTMKAYLESELGLHPRQADVQRALSLLNEELQVERTPSMRPKRRHEAIFHGPDYCWSIDGHDKFTHFGIEIYGMIDCHSRK